MALFWDIVCDTSWLPIITTIITVVVACMLPMYVYFQWSNERMIQIITALTIMTGLPAFLVISGLVLNTVCVVPNAKAAFKVGLPNTSVNCYIPRQELAHKIQGILRPPSADDEPVHPGGYYLIEGQHGCGKTTILKRALVESGPGILYVPLGVDGDVSVSLYEALKINMYCKGYWVKLSSYLKLPSEICHDDPLDCLKFAFQILRQAAAEIIQEERYIPAVVFDNLSQMLKQQKFNGMQVMAVLQDSAKFISDDGLLIVVFVSSGSGIPNLLSARSSASRLFGGVDVGDITDEQALEYLTCLCNDASSNEITAAVKLVGGHFTDLLSAAAILSERGDHRNETLEQRLLKIRGRLEKTLLSALPKRVFTAVQGIAHGIVKSTSGILTMKEYRSFIEELDEKDLQLINNLNIFLINPQEVSFHSRLTKLYFESLFKIVRLK